MNAEYLYKRFFRIIFIMLLISQGTEAMIYFMPTEQLVERSQYIGAVVDIVENKLEVIEIIKGSHSLENPFVLHTLSFDGWMEDNVKLPQPKDRRRL